LIGEAVAFIRVGFFEDFKGANTLLLDVDCEGLNALVAWLIVKSPNEISREW
jgi:hypothetical protein